MIIFVIHKRLCIKAMEAIIAVASMAFSWSIALLFVL